MTGDQRPSSPERPLLDRIEAGLSEIIADPGPTVADGEIVRDRDGRPIPDERVRSAARRVLGQVLAERWSLTGGGA